MPTPIRVTAGIIRRDDRILIARRREGSSLAGLLEFPGGKIEDGETAEECLAPELKEEFAIACRIGRLVSANHHDYPTFSIHLEAFELERLDGEYNPSSHDDIRWVEPRELLTFELAPADIPIARTLVEEVTA